MSSASGLATAPALPGARRPGPRPRRRAGRASGSPSSAARSSDRTCVLLALFPLVPILAAVPLSFHAPPAASASPQWIGSANYARLLAGPRLLAARSATRPSSPRCTSRLRSRLGLALAVLLDGRPPGRRDLPDDPLAADGRLRRLVQPSSRVTMFDRDERARRQGAERDRPSPGAAWYLDGAPRWSR